MMHARNVTANSRAANIMRFFSEYLERVFPARNLQNNDATLKIPTRKPISPDRDPNRAR
jgi:hypothetical protein